MSPIEPQHITVLEDRLPVLLLAEKPVTTLQVAGLFGLWRAAAAGGYNIPKIIISANLRQYVT